jgi:hypothetical protein
MSTSVLAAQVAADFKPCTCRAKAPGRACCQCLDTRWLKRCQSCLGDGLLYKQSRQANAQSRTERCGFCMGAGWIPCPKPQIPTDLPAPEAAPSMPLPAQVARRVAARRTQIKKSKPKLSGKRASIGVERVQNPVEAKELYKYEDNPADPLAQDAQDAQAAAQPAQPGSFAPDDLPPAA